MNSFFTFIYLFWFLIFESITMERFDVYKQGDGAAELGKTWENKVYPAAILCYLSPPVVSDAGENQLTINMHG
jgi:hypothetical protein